MLRQRRIDRSLMPMISAACHHVIFFAIARKSLPVPPPLHRAPGVRVHACDGLLLPPA